MLEQIARRAAVILIGCLILPSCAHFTQSGRQQLAYARYVRKQSGIRQRQQVKFKKTRMPKLPPADQNKDRVNAESSESPQSVSTRPPPQPATTDESETNQ
jgi:hypothetical protein